MKREYRNLKSGYSLASWLSCWYLFLNTVRECCDATSAVIEKRLIWDDRKKSYGVFGVISVPDGITAEELQKLRAEFDLMVPENPLDGGTNGKG